MGRAVKTLRRSARHRRWFDATYGNNKRATVTLPAIVI